MVCANGVRPLSPALSLSTIHQPEPCRAPDRRHSCATRWRRRPCCQPAVPCLTVQALYSPPERPHGAGGRHLVVPAAAARGAPRPRQATACGLHARTGGGGPELQWFCGWAMPPMHASSLRRRASPAACLPFAQSTGWRACGAPARWLARRVQDQELQPISDDQLRDWIHATVGGFLCPKLPVPVCLCRPGRPQHRPGLLTSACVLRPCSPPNPLPAATCLPGW